MREAQILYSMMSITWVNVTNGIASISRHERVNLFTINIKLLFHSFIQTISIAPLPVRFLLRSAPDSVRILCRSFTPKRHRQLSVKDLPKVPTWRLERESNPWPSGWKLSTQPMRHHVPQSFVFLLEIDGWNGPNLFQCKSPPEYYNALSCILKKPR